MRSGWSGGRLQDILLVVGWLAGVGIVMVGLTTVERTLVDSFLDGVDFICDQIFGHVELCDLAEGDGQEVLIKHLLRVGKWLLGTLLLQKLRLILNELREENFKFMGVLGGV